MINDCTGVILAGGRSTRYGGRNKALAPFGEGRLMDAVLRPMTEIFGEKILIVSRETGLYGDFGFPVVADVLPVPGAATGIHAGLFHAKTDTVFVVACDMPFIRPELIRLVLSHMHPPLLALFPCHGKNHLEPLCAAYHRDGLPVLESHILEGKSKVQWIFTNEKKGLVPESLLREADEDLQSFININSPEDARKAREALMMFP
ncbi:molybdenum cofactor guanylyltransferase [Desulfobotulus mexicanus]|uniref:Probable molybdenum cofactor guanylyltransferase n=1 Tax=Desulfobotulus mexicanus TaxID=2586642 RepID=A0A5S5MD04_9BACT|nr:molybdenum cofactor guanylyltransferase [Desulfobotulus mexicanus]TYT73570.1 molybdenum cofactor guanylyltransferase [Desulfobotulus mexicanus]